jgi:hypothetical protein
MVEVPHSLRSHLEEALQQEAAALQHLARLSASRASRRELEQATKLATCARAKRIEVQRQIEDKRP